ncbi:MAG TPA: T9SS type A sorting domain-containing protein [Candidatus Cloacimonadota bacterium]|nr:T9SS type A sorting domain-containing protein [Candidatus Cloacimonadota bacterium]
MDSSSDTVTGSIINNAPAQMDLPTVGSYSGQTMQITPSTGGDADYSVSVAAVDNGLSYSVSCESDVYLNGTYVITHPGLTATNINVPMGKLTISAQDLGSTSFSIDGFGAKGTIDFSLLFGDDTLPVEMGNMSVSPIGAHAVNLEWLSHSETNLLGYYVWRSETGSLQDARMISPLIQATNSSNGNAYVFQDTNDAPSASYWVEAVEYDGASTYHGPVIYQAPEQGSEAPEIQRTALESIYPNPFNPTTTISYWLKERQSVSLRIYDYRGRLVHSVNKVMQETGKHSYIWNAGDAASGVYLMKLQIGRESFVRKMVLLK